MRKFIFDCDPGVDDLLALAYILKKKMNVVGITTVSGNVNCDKTTINTLKFLQLYGADIPVYKGAKTPLNSQAIHAELIHGVDGCHGILDDIQLTTKERSKPAHRYIIEEVLASKRQIEIIAVAPLTNIALAMIEKPEIAQYIKHIYIMGGGHKNGNITPAAEFNFYADPYAAKVVFESGVPITMAGLDATMSFGVSENEIDKLTEKSTSTEQNQVVLKLLRENLKISRLFGFDEAYVHDLIAVVSAVKPELMETKKYFVGIETKGKFTLGKSVVDVENVLKREKNANVGLSLNKDVFLQSVSEILADD